VIKPKELIYNFSPISYFFFRNNPNDKSPIKYTHLMVVEKSTTGGLTNVFYIYFCFCIKRSLGLFHALFFFFILRRRMEMGHHQGMGHHREMGHHQDLSRDQRNY